MEKYKILKDLVSINTINDKENKKIINYIEEYLKNLGFKTEYKTQCLVMSIGENPRFGFLGHTDTVEYIEEFKNPFELTLKDGYLYGLGACDMKSGIAAMLDAVTGMDFKNLKYGIKLYFTYDEEIGFLGINELVSKNESFPEYMIFGEPTNNEIFVGHKGMLEYEMTFIGKKAHSSTPEKGVSANLNAAKFICELQNFYNESIKNDKINTYEVPYTTMNVGLINGGSAKNSIPASCKITIDFRLIKTEHIKLIEEVINKLSIKYNAKVKITELLEPFSNEIDFLDTNKTTNFMTEASKVNQSKRMILGAGPVTAHEVNEKISVQSYDKLINQYKDLIFKICK